MTDTKTLNNNQKWARAFTIFALYPDGGSDEVAAEHDEVYAGPNPDVVSPEHLAELETLGWTPDSESGECFHKFT